MSVDGASTKHVSERCSRVHAHQDWTAAHKTWMKLIESHRSVDLASLTDSRYQVEHPGGVELDADRGRRRTTTSGKDSSKPSSSISTSCSTLGSPMLSQHARGSACLPNKAPPTSSHGATTAGLGTTASAHCPMPKPQYPQSRRSMVLAAATTKPLKKPQARN